MPADLYERLKNIRRELHSWPELGFQEERTRAYLKGKLAELGLQVEERGGGLTASLRKGPGKTVALRADMDALPIQDAKEVPYASKNPGVCHACGHDGHMAMVLGAAYLLKEADYSGEVRFLFQPAEELPPGGALAMLEAGALQGVDAVFGLHLNPFIPFGAIGVKEGDLMAAADRFVVTILGKGGHGAIPHKSVDAVVTASHAVQALQALASRFTDPLEPLVLTVARIQGGTAFNIIAGEVELEGTVRTFNPSLREQVPKLMERTLKGVTAAYGAEYSFSYTRGYPPLVNHPGETRLVLEAARGLWGREGAIDLVKPLMGSEDFAYFLEKTPGCYFFLGFNRGEEGISIHHPRFDIDEEVLPLGARLLEEIALRYLGGR